MAEIRIYFPRWWSTVTAATSVLCVLAVLTHQWVLLIPAAVTFTVSTYVFIRIRLAARMLRATIRSAR